MTHSSCISAVVGGLMIGVLAVGAVSAQDARFEKLRADRQVTDGLVLVAIGRRIVKGCDAIQPNRMRAFFFANGLKLRARELGYSDGEITAFIEDEAEKARIDAMSDNWLKARRTHRTDAPGLCRVGAEEIARGTQLGRMLRKN
jgi:hypothetical protein